MSKNFANKIYKGTSKQTAAANKNFYITAIVGTVDSANDIPTAITVAFDDLTDLVMMDHEIVSFPYPIMTSDFTPSSNTVSVVYYEGL